MPIEINTPLPEVPRDMEMGGKFTICAEIVVSSVGDVQNIDLRELAEDCANSRDGFAEMLSKAVLEAVSKWEYIAAGVCRYQHSAAECESSSANVEAIPVKLAYKFVFSDQGVTIEADSERAGS